MDIKLTLKLEEKVIEKAEQYARVNNTSLSKMIEGYLERITTGNEEKEELTPLVKSISGIIKPAVDKEYKDDYSKYLENKYK